MEIRVHTKANEGANSRSGDVTTLGTILSVWAHPDDETYLSGGIMAAARDRGQRVVCASVSAGELGTADPATWPPERLGPVRRWEAAAAMGALGVGEHEILGLPDGQLAAHDAAGIAWVGELIDTVGPNTILTFGPDGITYHPDHIAVHRWVTAAWEQRGCRARLMYATTTEEHLDRFGDMYESWGVYMSDERPTGVQAAHLGAHAVLDGRALDRKVTALRAMATQTASIIEAVGSEAYAEMVAEESFVDATGAVADQARVSTRSRA